MFCFLEDFDIANYADDTTPYCAGKSAEFVVNNLEQSSAILFEWLNNNYMKVNTGKSHLLLSGNSRATATIDNRYIESEDEQALLGITVESNLTFENHINRILKKASQKLNALSSLYEYTEAKNTDIYLRNCKIFKNTYFEEHLQTTASYFIKAEDWSKNFLNQWKSMGFQFCKLTCLQRKIQRKCMQI